MRAEWPGSRTPAARRVDSGQAGEHLGAPLVNEPDTLTWNELTSDDLAGALPFYEAVVGISPRDAPMGDDPYTTLYVGEDMVGGATAPQVEGVANHWHVWFAVGDTDEAVARATGIGGSVAFGPLDIPIGRVAALADPQGAMFSVIAMTSQPGARGAACAHGG